MHSQAPSIKKNWHQIVILIIMVLATVIRVKAQGDPRLSIANDDTSSYVTSSEISLLSWEAFTGRRLFTTNLIFQLFKPEEGYEILVNGSGNTTKRQLQPSFVNIALLQFIVSIISWYVLTLTIVRRLKNPIPKILAALLIPAFAFVPQMADWDSVLSSESFSLSLFALQTGLLLELAFLMQNPPGKSLHITLLASVWTLVVLLWAFLKDAHLYGVIVLAAMLAVTLIPVNFLKQKIVYLSLLILTASILIGWSSAGNSKRSLIQLEHVYTANILTNPAYVASMQEYGMPDHESPEYEQWFISNAKDAYLKFLLTHPGYTVTAYFKDIPYAFSENAQSYFNTQPQYQLRKALIPVGDILHPEHWVAMYADILILLGILAIALKNSSTENKTWAWISTWMFLSASANMFINIFGDVYALPRHALVATMIFRLFMWIFIIVIVDMASDSPSRPVIADNS
ncbi:MAG: hypothetical protein IPN96_21755 [Anaerolineales bacterium]|nr:hypothetical protein [Anaerolineales bacterium]